MSWKNEWELFSRNLPAISRFYRLIYVGSGIRPSPINNIINVEYTVWLLNTFSRDT